MPLSLRALSEIRCVGSLLIAIMDQGSEVECSWILREIITRNRHSLRGVFRTFREVLNDQLYFDSFAKGLLDTHFFETYSLSSAV